VSTRRFDPVSALLAAVTVVALVWAGWLRFGPEAALEPPGVGTAAPHIRLLDTATSEPLVLLGLHGRVVWLAFWAAGGPAGESDRAALEHIWARLKDRRRFIMLAASVDSPPRLSQAPTKPRLPVYVATPETRRAFGADARHLPLHVLIDETGRVGAVAQGMRPETLVRLKQQAEAWLDALEPLGTTRFAERRFRTPEFASPGAPHWRAVCTNHLAAASTTVSFPWARSPALNRTATSGSSPRRSMGRLRKPV
jgi:hypothetical protein